MSNMENSDSNPISAEPADEGFWCRECKQTFYPSVKSSAPKCESNHFHLPLSGFPQNFAPEIDAGFDAIKNLYREQYLRYTDDISRLATVFSSISAAIHDMASQLNPATMDSESVAASEKPRLNSILTKSGKPEFLCEYKRSLGRYAESFESTMQPPEARPKYQVFSMLAEILQKFASDTPALVAELDDLLARRRRAGLAVHEKQTRTSNSPAEDAKKIECYRPRGTRRCSVSKSVSRREAKISAEPKAVRCRKHSPVGSAEVQRPEKKSETPEEEKRKQPPVVTAIRIEHPMLIENPGAMCFMNAVLQCLFGTKPLVKIITSFEPRPKEQEFYQTMRVTAKSYAQLQEKEKIHPQAIAYELSVAFPHLKYGSSNDAAAAFSAFIGLFRKEESNMDPANRVSSIFHTDICTRYECKSCTVKRYRKSSAFVHAFSSSFTSPNMLAAPILRYVDDCMIDGEAPKRLYSIPYIDFVNKRLENVQNMLYANLQAKLVNGYICQTCGQENTSWISTYFMSVPQVFVLHLERPEHLLKEFRNVLAIDLTDFIMFSGCVVPAERCKYELYAMVMYNGDGHYGHYNAFVKYGSGAQWFHIDDGGMEKVGEDVVVKQPPGYLYFYERMPVYPRGMNSAIKDNDISHNL